MILAVPVVFFLLGAVAGLFLAIRHFTKRRLPPAVAVVHGLAGATGFACLLYAVIKRPDFTPLKVAVAILIVGVAFGCVNAVYHIRGRRHRSTLIVAHALIAFSGVATLGYGIWVSLTSSASESSASSSSSANVGPAALPPTPPPPIASTAPPVVASAAANTVGSASATPASSASAASAASSSSSLLGVAFTREKVTFDANSATLTEAARVSLSAIAEELKRTPEVQLVEIQGYADPRGDDLWNISLTRSRAYVVRQTLVALGVQGARLRSAGYGARCPLNPACAAASSCTAEISEHERRVTFMILENGGKRFRGQLTCANAVGLIPHDDVAYHSSGN